ncbi:hypothetical protein B5M42_001935 [Paenibacillus athensensis]|uniref:Uncharacterized protein n=1 Tax=Paenibacillus athensensis TaxID=1967502 RepID=A0A4Y8QBS2_9BACL|nr:M91 family zinc metallopeptidase [Paenibacillus athensensis]MCD1257597.1 hypothetical protein [Paenibacillus athensensis]
MKTHAPKIPKIQKKAATPAAEPAAADKIPAHERDSTQTWQPTAPGSSLSGRLQQQSASVPGILQLQRSLGNRLTASLLAQRQQSNSDSSPTHPGPGSMVIQRRLSTSADQFNTNTTIPKPHFLGSESKLTDIVKALTDYENSLGTPSVEVTKLLKIYKLCSSTISEHKKQLEGMQNLKFEIYQEALGLMPAIVKEKFGNGDPTESLYQSTFNGNSFSGFSISDLEYQSAVLSQSYDLTRIDEAFQGFMATTPALGTKNEEWHTACKKWINQTQKRVITKEAYDQLKTRLNVERKRLLDREDDKNKLKSMFDVTDQLDFLTGAPNQVSHKEFGEITDLYSNIREGKSHFKISDQQRDRSGDTITDSAMNDVDSEDFKGKALDDIAKILQVPNGRKLMKLLGSGGKSGTLDLTLGKSTDPMKAHHQSLDDTTSSDGTGSSSNVFYTAGASIDLPLHDGNVSTTSDTALFHELTHAYHSFEGKKKKSDDKIDLVDVLSQDDLKFKDIGVKREEHATVGLGTFKDDEVTENKYRQYHRDLVYGNSTEEDKYKHRGSYL